MKTQRYAAHLVVVTTIAIAATAAVTTWAQAPQDMTPASMSALIGEVRQLRVAIEESGKRQSETQALAVYLSAQQSRLVQISQQLEATRAQLTETSGQLQQFKGLLTSMQADTTSINPSERQEAEGFLKMFKPQLDQAALKEQQLRAREAELAQSLVTEQGRWSDLISRLEQMIKR
jgi:DNA repair exonuclease SbcCD ATPase subunit